jgi:hypothetical protein
VSEILPSPGSSWQAKADGPTEILRVYFAASLRDLDFSGEGKTNGGSANLAHPRFQALFCSGQNLRGADGYAFSALREKGADFRG